MPTFNVPAGSHFTVRGPARITVTTTLPPNPREGELVGTNIIAGRAQALEGLRRANELSIHIHDDAVAAPAATEFLPEPKPTALDEG